VKTILVGYDGSEGAVRALDRAVEVAKAFGAKLVVVSVAELPVAPAPYAVGPTAGLGAMPLPDTPRLDVAPEEIVARVLDEARARVAGVEATFEARGGDPDQSLIAAADEHGADLIVVGTREPGFLGRLLEGSVSSDLARHAHCDVLVVHPPHAGRS
jgi:nucleotide-binding universal stress UspA family protein